MFKSVVRFPMPTAELTVVRWRRLVYPKLLISGIVVMLCKITVSDIIHTAASSDIIHTAAADSYRSQPRNEVEMKLFQGRCSRYSPCHQICADKFEGGFVCACRAGFHLRENGFSCARSEKSDKHSTHKIERSDIKPQASDVVRVSDDDAILDDANIDRIFHESSAPWKYRNVNNLSHDWSENFQHDDAYGLLNDQPYKLSHLQDNDNGVRRKPSSSSSSSSSFSSTLISNRPPSKSTAQKKSYREIDPFGSHPLTAKESYIDDELSLVGDGDLDDDADDDDFGKPQDGDSDGDDVIGSSDRASIHREIPETGAGVSEGEVAALCRNVPCVGGGWCLVSPGGGAEGAARCRCPLGTNGKYCEKESMIKYPRFTGTGYIVFPVLRGADREFVVTVEFRPDAHHGLVLFSGDQSEARFDFFSIAVVNGRIEFRFDCGSGLAVLRTLELVQHGSWNMVTVHRVERNAWIRLNNGTVVRGKAKGKFTRINFRGDLYLGGYRDVKRIGDRTGAVDGFVGCVRRLTINDKTYDMRKSAYIGDAVRGYDVDDCSRVACADMKCLNGGSCVASSADTAVCLCPLGTLGSRCETNGTVHIPLFQGSSYLQYHGLKRSALSFIELELIIKPTDGDGLILYNGYTRDRTGDFISVALAGGYVEYRFDLGTGPAIIRSRHPVSLHEWHVIGVSRTGRTGFLKVNNDSLVEGTAQGAFTQLTLTLDMFVGGHRNYDEVARWAQVDRSFRGCIQRIIVNRRPMKLMEEVITGVNVGNCRHQCVNQPCLNGGRCQPHHDTYTCRCSLHYENDHCQLKVTEPFEIPEFSRDSYLLFNDPLITERTRGKTIDLQMRVKAKDGDGLLFWVGEEEMSPFSDYFAVGLKDGHVIAQYNLGSGEGIMICNHTGIDDNKWHTIRIHRFEKIGNLEIDGALCVVGTSQGNMKQLTTCGTIYIGGMDDIVHGTLRKYSAGFTGCISNVTLGGDYQVNLMKDAEEGINISRCGKTARDHVTTAQWLAARETMKS